MMKGERTRGSNGVQRFVAAIVMSVGLGTRLAAAEQRVDDQTIRALIAKAGNADADTDRLACLEKLRALPGLDASLKADADRLIAEVNRYIHNKHLPYFSGQVGKTRDYDFKIDEASALYPLTFLYRGRMLTWQTLESGSIINDPKRRREFLDKARGFFEQYASAFPKNRIARMYLGEPIPPDKHYPGVPGAPEWAVLQREGLERVTDIIEWWIDHRMQPDGQYGGGWGDDCEMWRFWVPVLIGFDSPKICQAQARFSIALMSLPHMKGGYTSHMTDVEHSAEDSSDVMTPMMHLDPDNDVWRRRALRLADLTETLWTGRNERGLLQFKSTYFNVDKVNLDPQRACDTVYHPRTVQPTLLLWQRTADERLTKLFSAWMDTWVDAAARAERGKPAGVVPSAIHWPDGKVGGVGRDWWDPYNHPSEPTLYRWPSALMMVMHTLLLTHHMTGQAKYLEPIQSMAAVRLKYLKDPPAEEPKPGTEVWCGSKLGSLAGVVAKYRLLTGRRTFDGLLVREKSPYMLLRMNKDRSRLVVALRENAEALRVNFPAYTSEVRWTDRVLRFPALFAENMMYPDRPVTNIHMPDTALLYATATGDPGDAGYFPLNAVRWLTPPRDLAALVTESGTNGFAAELFHFGQDSRVMSAELYLLAPGEYTMTLIEATTGRDAPVGPRPVTVKGPRTRVAFELPSRRWVVLKVARK